MRHPILVLDTFTANQIAAGEVVERPASVVKELVENAIDAGSSRVDVRIWSGGTQEIQVSDNGTGIPRQEVLLAFQRHATSKIRSADDLLRIATLGFRGEALPSIASVARVAMTTRTAEESEGTRITLEPGREPVISSTGCPVGTTVTVSELFFNTPARRKFLKTPLGEAGAVGDILQRLALANPRISFKLTDDRKIALMTPGSGDLRETFASIYGVDTARAMLPVNFRGTWGEANGLVSPPTISKGSRHHQTFVVNGRFVRSRILSQAMDTAYYTLLGAGRYPLAVLHLWLDAEKLDANVHPAKLEIRFYREEEVIIMAREAISGVLRGHSLVPGIEKPPGEGPKIEKPTHQSYRQISVPGLPPFDRVAEPPAGDEEYTGGQDWTTSRLPVEIPPQADLPVNDTTEHPVKPRHPELSGLIPLGQLEAAYILAQGQEGLYIIDQHAAHERILYEQIRQQAEDSSLPSQGLVVPSAVELTHEESVQLMKHIIFLTELGFILEHFGGNTFLVRAIPAGLEQTQEDQLLKDMLDLLREMPGLDDAGFREAAVKMMACRRAIKAHQRLAPGEMSHLLWKLSQAKEPYTCPHGRPTVVLITSAELARRFKRSAPA